MPENNGSRKIYVSFAGLPLTFDLKWPFHPSTSGSDWWVLHGTIGVENASGPHALVAVNLSATIKEVMPSLDPKDAQGPVVNALRKEIDRKSTRLNSSHANISYAV